MVAFALPARAQYDELPASQPVEHAEIEFADQPAADAPTLAPIQNIEDYEAGYENLDDVQVPAEQEPIEQVPVEQLPVEYGDAGGAGPTCLGEPAGAVCSGQSCGCSCACVNDCRGCYEVRPVGRLVHSAMSTQVRNGMAARTTLYRYDFVDSDGNESQSLSPRGQIELDGIISRWQAYGVPIMVEASGIAELDEQRRLAVVGQMEQRGYQLEPDMVLVATKSEGGLQGLEARVIHGKMLQHTISGGGSRGRGSGGQGFIGFGTGPGNSRVGNIGFDGF